MIIEEIALKDFRSHAESRVRFTPGVTVIVGENGSGKSTLLEAVNFALFKSSRRGYPLDDLIRRGASLAKVDLIFHAGGRRYRVERRRTPGRAAGSALYELRDGAQVPVARGEARVTREIERILGMNSEVFTSAIYIRQGEIDALLSFEPAVRKRLIGKLLGAEDLERAHAGMREVVAAFKQRHAALGGVEEELERSTEELREKRAELQRLQRLLEDAISARGKVAGSLRELDEKLLLVEEGLRLMHRRRMLEAEMSHLRERLERLSHYAARLEALGEMGERYLALEESLRELREKEKRLSVVEALYRAKVRERKEAEEKLREVEDHIEKLLRRVGKALGLAAVPAPGELEEALQRRVGELEDAKHRIRRAIEETTREAANLRGKAREAERALKELLAARSSCPVCMSPLSRERKEEVSREYRRRSREWVQRAEALERGMEESRAELSYVEKRLAEVNRIAGELSVVRRREAERRKLRQRCDELREELRSLEEERRRLAPLAEKVAELEAERAKLAGVYEEYVEAKGYLSRHAGEEEALERRLGEAEEELEGIANSLAELREKLGCEVSEELHRELRGRREELQAKLTELEKGISAGEEGVRRVGAEIERLEERLRVLREKLAERERLEGFISLLEKIRGLFHRDSLQRELRRRAIPLIERYTREVFEEFNLPYSELTLNEDFSVTLYGPLGEESADMLSGGERVALALALRLGIARALSGSALEMIMLDEPTVHLDAQRRQELVEIIKRLTSIPQTIVVTHDKEFEQAADRLLLVEKRSGISRVVEAD
ncbi:MAG: AAA family ATPase [Euryarchaeota archaeon]|nr:AAA family ATPase [Euryarchaeota archaeon]